jgi:putative mRNA 3-end processing factor
MLEMREAGLYCAAGDFYIDPSLPVPRAIITHAHSDHACPGSAAYLTARAGMALARERLGAEAAVEGLEYGERIELGEAIISFHPAGHILGSAQVRIERRGEVWVVSGDYKLETDPTCAPFERVPCDTFVTESTFALPIFRWPDPKEVVASIADWWRGNREADRVSVLFATPLGKAQRILAALDTAIGPVYSHPVVERYNRIYRELGVPLPETAAGKTPPGSLLLAPPGWDERVSGASRGMASGWMRIRGPRRRRSLDRGFVLSDHADWPALLRTIEGTGAEAVWPVHGYTTTLSRWLLESGRKVIGELVGRGDGSEIAEVTEGREDEDERG